MDNQKRAASYLWELDDDFQLTGNAEEDNRTRMAFLRNVGIPKIFDAARPQSDDGSSDSDSLELSERKYDVRLDPECSYPCEKDIGWFDYAMSSTPWDDSRRPYEQVLKSDDIALTEKEQTGELSGMVVSTGINFFDAIPMKDGFALSKLQLSNRELTNVQLLDRYKYLKYLDISRNAIQDLSPISRLVYLIYLDASHNEIAEYNPNPCPWFITNLNFSNNKFETMPQLSSMWSLKYLNLSNNLIKKIEGVKSLRYLQYLNLSHNSIEIIENIDDVPLKALDLSWNRITRCEDSQEGNGGLKNVLTLRRLDVSHNQIRTLDDLSCFNVFYVRHLNIGYNKFDCVMSFDDLARYRSLKYLRIDGNEMIDELPDIVRMIIHSLPLLSYVNGRKLTKIERLSAYSMWSTDLVINGMKNYCYDLLYSNAPPPCNNRETPRNLDYDIPIVILVGPMGSMKNRVAKLLAEEYSDHIKLPTLHTTMLHYNPTDDLMCDELKALKLEHIDQDKFNTMRNRGEFVFVHSDFGDNFGLSRNELVDEVRMCLLPLPIGPALSLTWQGLNTTLIRVKTAALDVYTNELQRYVTSRYIVHNQQVDLQEAENLITDDESDINSKKSSTDAGLHRSKSKSLVFEESVSTIVSKTSSHSSVFSCPSSNTLFRDETRKSDSRSNFEIVLQPLNWWSEDSADRVEEEENLVETAKLSFIDSLRMSTSAKQQIMRIYEQYYKEWEEYNELNDSYFATTFIVDDLNAAAKKIVTLLAERYNSFLDIGAHQRATEESDLFDELVEPRVKEMMEILHDKRTIDVPSKITPPDLGISLSRLNLSSSFVEQTRSQSSLDLTPSIIDSDCLIKRIAEPSDITVDQLLPTPPSTPSSILEAIAKESMEKAGFSVNKDRHAIIYDTE